MLSISDEKNIHLRTHALTLGLSYYFTNCAQNICDACCCDFCGPYLGAGLGAGILDGKHHLDIVTVSPNTADIAAIHENKHTEHLTDGSFRGIFFLGYGLQWRALFAGIEIFGQYSPFSKHKNDTQIFDDSFNPVLFSLSNTVSTKLKINPWQYGIAIRPGVLLSPETLLYVTVGTSVARLRAHSDVNYNNPAAGIVLDFPLSAHSTRAVLRLGGGIEYILCGDWHLRADYTHTDYRSLRLRGSQATPSSIGTISLTSESYIHPTDHSITLSISKYL